MFKQLKNWSRNLSVVDALHHVAKYCIYPAITYFFCLGWEYTFFYCWAVEGFEIEFQIYVVWATKFEVTVHSWVMLNHSVCFTAPSNLSNISLNYSKHLKQPILTYWMTFTTTIFFCCKKDPNVISTCNSSLQMQTEGRLCSCWDPLWGESSLVSLCFFLSLCSTCVNGETEALNLW